MNYRRTLLPLAACAGLLFPVCTSASNWANWRGPYFNGSADGKKLPIDFDQKKNVKWSTKVPGVAAATPIIWDNHIFISTADEDKKTLNAMAIDRRSGKVIWNKVVNDGALSQDSRSNFASPSPTTDGERVVYFYGNGDLIAFDFHGKKIWQRNIQKDYGEFAFQWTFSSSPLLHKGTLYLQVLQRNAPARGRGKDNAESFLLAMDPATGKTRWKQLRPSDAVGESLEAFSTPIPHVENGREELIIVGGDCLTGHDLKTGKELWRWGTWNPTRIGHWRLVPSAVAGGGVVLACAPKNAPIYAVKSGQSGTLSMSAVAWTSDPRADNVTSDVPTPLFYDGDFFVLSDTRRDNMLTRIDPKTGKAKWSTPVPEKRKKWRSSPTGADGKIYFMDHAANVVIVDARSGKILKQIAMGQDGDDYTRSSIVVAHGQLFIRTNWKLFCIGK
mgnify:CR=1 FL=1